MYQYSLQSSYAIAECCQVHNSMEKVAHFQFHAHSDKSSSSLAREHLDGSKEHYAKIQMHTVCMGAAELSFENEVRHPIPHIIPFQQIFQLFSKVRSILGIPIY